MPPPLAAMDLRVSQTVIAMSITSTKMLIGNTSRMNSVLSSPQTLDWTMFGLSPHLVEKPPRLLATSIAHNRYFEGTRNFSHNLMTNGVMIKMAVTLCIKAAIA
jgi:hypothetical protein